jgi:hypothetical protein
MELASTGNFWRGSPGATFRGITAVTKMARERVSNFFSRIPAMRLWLAGTVTICRIVTDFDARWCSCFGLSGLGVSL